MQSTLKNICSLGVLLTIALPGRADVGAGLQAYQNGEYGKARDIWLLDSEKGDPRANFYLSQMYKRGVGVNRNPHLALEFLSTAARAGLASAQFNLGNRYNEGRGIEEDPAKAASWWRLAAQQDMPLAQYNLATLYYLGRGVGKNLDKAVFWYRRSAKQGSERAKKALKAIGKSAEVNISTPMVVEQAPQVASTSRPRTALTPKPQSKTASRSRPATSTASIGLGSGWVKRQPGHLFTLQIFAAESGDSVDKLFANYRLKRQLAVYRFIKNGKVWYGVTYGRFANAELARNALAELPAKVRKGSPWARRFADIQALIVDDPKKK